MRPYSAALNLAVELAFYALQVEYAALFIIYADIRLTDSFKKQMRRTAAWYINRRKGL